jgi:hypothetical protein
MATLAAISSVSYDTDTDSDSSRLLSLSNFPVQPQVQSTPWETIDLVPFSLFRGARQNGDRISASARCCCCGE